MRVSAAQLAAQVSGQVVGDPQRLVSAAGSLRAAGPETCTYASGPAYAAQAAASAAGVVLLAQATLDAVEAYRARDGAQPATACPAATPSTGPEPTNRPLPTFIVCQDASYAMAQVTAMLHPPAAVAQAVHPTASIHPTSQVHPTASVGPHAVIESGAHVGAHAQIGPQATVGCGARVGAHSVLHAGARLMWGCSLGERTVLQPGAVVGGDGFGYVKDPAGPGFAKVPQLGVVQVGCDVEIGANSTIDRATFGATVVGNGCKIDNLVQVGHNVVLGDHCIVVAQSGIAGSATLGHHVVVGAQGGINGHITIAPGTRLAARTGVVSTLTTAGTYAGMPAMPHPDWLRMTAVQRDLVNLRRRLAALERAQAVPCAKDSA